MRNEAILKAPARSQSFTNDIKDRGKRVTISGLKGKRGAKREGKLKKSKTPIPGSSTIKAGGEENRTSKQQCSVRGGRKIKYGGGPHSDKSKPAGA